ncbi:MAG: hypothetical protein EAZ92_10435 [Candidatus Kapaibacterium sp.]|nr:MAG: hypothetical protein EAZ92_10435 [Candidatus Kapabacteria bacterium]
MKNFLLKLLALAALSIGAMFIPLFAGSYAADYIVRDNGKYCKPTMKVVHYQRRNLLRDCLFGTNVKNGYTDCSLMGKITNYNEEFPCRGFRDNAERFHRLVAITNPNLLSSSLFFSEDLYQRSISNQRGNFYFPQYP